MPIESIYVETSGFYFGGFCSRAEEIYTHKKFRL